MYFFIRVCSLTNSRTLTNIYTKQYKSFIMGKASGVLIPRCTYTYSNECETFVNTLYSCNFAIAYLHTRAAYYLLRIATSYLSWKLSVTNKYWIVSHLNIIQRIFYGVSEMFQTEYITFCVAWGTPICFICYRVRTSI